MQWDNDVNGICYRIELSCIEDLAGGSRNASFALTSSTLGTYEHQTQPTGDPTIVANIQENIWDGKTITVNDVRPIGDDNYLYLCARTTGSATGPYTAGKLIFRFYSHIDF